MYSARRSGFTVLPQANADGFLLAIGAERRAVSVQIGVDAVADVWIAE